MVEVSIHFDGSGRYEFSGMPLSATAQSNDMKAGYSGDTDWRCDVETNSEVVTSGPVPSIRGDSA